MLLQMRSGVSFDPSSGPLAAVAFTKAYIFAASFADRTSQFSAPGSNVAILTAYQNYLYLGHATKFSGVEVLLAQAATHSAEPSFEYSDGSGGWLAFNPVDNTGGLAFSGTIAWTSENAPAWKPDTVSATGGLYWIRIRRTYQGAMTAAQESTIKAIAPSEFGWDRTAVVTLRTLTFETTNNSATPGNVTQLTSHGSVAIPAGVSTVVVTNPTITDSTVASCSIAGSADDATLKRIHWRVEPGKLTIVGNANATLATRVNYSLAN